jgi:Zn-dependent peptidase ImmA (M78 family)
MSKQVDMSNIRIIGLVLLLSLVVVGCTQDRQPRTTQPPLDQTASPTAGDTSSGDASLEAMQVIEQRVSELRGLETLRPVKKALLTTDELREKMEQDAEKDYSKEEAHDDELLYRAFELVEPGVDLYNLLIDVQTEQVLGFYDPDTQEMYIVKSKEEPGALERWTFSHEYTHVLQDQHFDLKALGFTSEGNDEKEDSERQFAIRSLVEGDATLLMQQYALQYFNVSELQEIVADSENADSSVLDAAPEVVRATLLFPYDAGFAFVTALFQDGGWPAVDAAYGDPPLSTEQIMHPERYPEDVPQVVDLPPLTDTLGSGWHLVDEDVLGEFGLELYLKVHVPAADAEVTPEVTPEVAAEGWGGDRYAVYWRDDESGFVMVDRLVWDTSGDAAEFFDAYTTFAENRFGSPPSQRDGDIRLWWTGQDALLLARNGQNETLVLIAPDEATLQEVYALFPDF